MKRILLSRALIAICLTASLWAASAQAAFLNSNTVQQMNNNTGIVQQGAGYDDTTLSESVGMIIKVFLGVLGVIFIILLIVAGFNWMTAAGDEEKIKKAMATIRMAIIGLVIIVSAYSITYFVFSNLPGGGN